MKNTITITTMAVIACFALLAPVPGVRRRQ